MEATRGMLIGMARGNGILMLPNPIGWIWCCCVIGRVRVSMYLSHIYTAPLSFLSFACRRTGHSHYINHSNHSQENPMLWFVLTRRAEVQKSYAYSLCIMDICNLI